MEKSSIIKVGDGRGFVTRTKYRTWIISAAHCLPQFPPCHGASYIEERIYRKLLAPLGDAEPQVSAECLFVDPIADITILASPDGQTFHQEAEGYEALTEPLVGFPIGRVRRSKSVVYVLSLAGSWVQHTAERLGGSLWLNHPEPGMIEAGMSGSPIINEAGEAVGVVCLTEGSASPCLDYHLPAGLLRALTTRRILAVSTGT